MHSTDLAHLKRRARRAYELSRLRSALFGVTPILLVIAGACCVTHRPLTTLWFGLTATCLGAVMLWYGRDPQKAVLPGVGAGLIPLVLALSTSHMHMCGPEGCSTLCLPACTLGGVIAGLVVATLGNQRKLGLWYWLGASSLALSTGAMGCACIGYSGVFGLAAGFAGGMVPGLLRRISNRGQ